MKAKIIILLVFVLCLFTFLFLYYINLREITGKVVFPPPNQESKIYTLTTEPEIEVLTEAKVLVGVQNNGKEKNNYKLYLFITKEGKVKDSTDFSFTLKPGDGATFTSTFTPTEIGKHEILAKLYDGLEMVLYDTRTLSIDTISKVGPFDFSLDLLTKTAEPGNSVPLVLKMKNIGEKGAEVKIKVSMYCEEKTLAEEFAIFLQPKIEKEKLLTFLTCSETGPNTIIAELFLFNATLAASSSQIFLREVLPTLKVKVPEKISLMQGQTEMLDIFIENEANISFSNLRLAVENLPIEWATVTPFTIINVKPGEEIIFILNLSIPEETKVGEYPIKIDVGGDEVFASKDSTLSIMAAAIPEEKKPKIKLEIGKNIRLISFLILGCFIMFFAVRRVVIARKTSEINEKKASIFKMLRH